MWIVNNLLRLNSEWISESDSWYLVLEKSEVAAVDTVDMPLFGKKNPASSGSKPAGPTPATPEPAAKKTPTVEDKYILKDVLGTWVI